jgi:hypothetical protein
MPGREPAVKTPRPVMPAEVQRAIRARKLAETQRDAAAATAVRVRRRTANRSLARILHNRKSLRQAIVVATVLGPCRALERD